jgi:hypothetical protein
MNATATSAREPRAHHRRARSDSTAATSQALILGFGDDGRLGVPWDHPLRTVLLDWGGLCPCSPVTVRDAPVSERLPIPWQGAGVGAGTSVTSIRRDRHLLVPTPDTSLVPTPDTSCPPPLLGRGAELLAEPAREGAGRFEAQQL